MQGYLALVFHAHLPFVRHPEHERFLEESWLFEAITETYLPLLQVLEGWRRDGLPARLTLSLSPTLCAMLLDPLLQRRYARHLDSLIELAGKELHRTHLDKPMHAVADLYHRRFIAARDAYAECGRNLVEEFRKFQDAGLLEIITCAATHALLPLLNHPPSVRAQILTAQAFHRRCFGHDPRGIWLPECAYSEGVEAVLQEANLRWFILDSHGLLHAQPKPRYGVFAPVFTPGGIAAFARDPESSKQVWSKHEGYPGDANYRDFYRDIGFDLDLDYVRPHLPAPDVRGFTGIKYHRITGHTSDKAVYDREMALRVAGEHAGHFLGARMEQARKLAGLMDRPPLLLAPYDAELFGHWWYEGPEFIDALVRKLLHDQKIIGLITPQEYLERWPTNQIATPAASSWGEEGYWRVWLNESNAWIYPHLRVAQERMSERARIHGRSSGVERRALQQAARELLLAQASDWPFILRTGTSPDYARQRIKDHLLRFTTLHEQLTSDQIDERWLKQLEKTDNLFPDVNPAHWA
jgi:1,4-alpha-glucan branching enzyme